MTIVVNPHNPQEEKALLAFLDSMKYGYSQEDEALVLSEAQQKEILECDREYEAVETETYSLVPVIKGDKNIDPSGLFGIWANKPRKIEDIRKAPWERTTIAE